MNKQEFIAMLMYLFDQKSEIKTPIRAYPALVVKFGEEKANAFVSTTLADAIQHVTISELLQFMAAE